MCLCILSKYQWVDQICIFEVFSSLPKAKQTNILFSLPLLVAVVQYRGIRTVEHLYQWVYNFLVRCSCPSLKVSSGASHSSEPHAWCILMSDIYSVNNAHKYLWVGVLSLLKLWPKNTNDRCSCLQLSKWILIKSMLSYVLLGDTLILYANFKNNNFEEREVEHPSSDIETLCPSIPKA